MIGQFSIQYWYPPYQICFIRNSTVMGRRGCSIDSSPLLLSVSPIVKLSRLNRLFLILILVMIFFSFLVQFLSFYVKVLLSRLDFWEAFNYVECLRSLVLIVDCYFISGTLRENLQRFRSFSSSSLLLINKPSIHLS